MKKKDEVKFGVILSLLNNRSILTPDLKAVLNHDRFLGEEINDTDISNVIKKLKKDEIIVIKPVFKEGRGANPNLIILEENLNIFIKILNELYDPKLDGIDNLSLIKRRFMRTPYVQNLIDEDLLEHIKTNIQRLIDDQIPGIDFEFTEVESGLILSMLRSPSALYYALITYRDDIKNKIREVPEEIKSEGVNSDNEFEDKFVFKISKRFIFKLQLNLLADIDKKIVD